MFRAMSAVLAVTSLITAVLAGASLIATVAFGPRAHAGAAIMQIDKARVPGGQGPQGEITLTYNCPRGSGQKLVVIANDTRSLALGHTAAVPVCDNKSRTITVEVTDVSQSFRYHDPFRVQTHLLDAHDRDVDGGSVGRMIVAY